jgi:hypothetical protein
LAIFILAARAVDETITKNVIVDASVAPDDIRRWTCKALHSVFGRWALYSATRQKFKKINYGFNSNN